MAIGLSGFPNGAAHDLAASRGGRGGRGHLRTARNTAGYSGGSADSARRTGREPGERAGQPAHRDSRQDPRGSDDAAPAQPDSRPLKKSLAQLEPRSQKVMAYFFATLFVRHPELRPMFPLALDAHRQRVFTALAHYAWSSDRPESLAGWLSELALEHRKFGVEESHYRPFCDALLAALASFGGGPAAGQAQAAWEGALDHIATVMAASARAAAGEPAWWLAEVTGHERPSPGVAVLTLRPAQPLRYRAGQHISVQVPRWPRVWREYSVANPPGPGGLLRLHVRAVPRGLVSNVLVHQTEPGDTLIVGRARGGMTPDAIPPGTAGGSVACFAGGTGLAPVKAVVTELLGAARSLPAPAIRLFFGARHEAGLYDLPDLRRLAEAHPSLTVIPVVSDEPGYPGITGTLAAAAAVHLPRDAGDVFISGPAGMVRATAEVAAGRAPAARIHFDPPSGSPPEPPTRAGGTPGPL